MILNTKEQKSDISISLDISGSTLSVWRSPDKCECESALGMHTLVPDPIRDVSLGGEDFWNIFILKYHFVEPLVGPCSHASSSPSVVTDIKSPVIFDAAVFCI